MPGLTVGISATRRPPSHGEGILQDLDSDLQLGYFFSSDLDSGLCGEDIWEKFELLPTPPSSPEDVSLPEMQGTMLELTLHGNQHEESYEGLWGMWSAARTHWEHEEMELPVVLRDCMWSGCSCETRSVTERCASFMGKGWVPHAPCIPPVEQMACTRRPATTLTPLQTVSDIGIAKLDSPWSTSEGETGEDTDGDSDKNDTEDDYDDCEDDDDDTEDDDDDETDDGTEDDNEEIDVVTVRTRRLARPPRSLHVLRAGPVHLLHSYAAPARRCLSPHTDTRCELSMDADSWDPRDSGRRRAHNVLERRRRHDLKRSFAALRESVPELDERAARATILQRATELARSLAMREQHLTSEKERERFWRKPCQQSETRPHLYI
uniref:MYCN proto-oncogene, bHLH transcription factor n=1 Tax=Eptatretus burgeri TaxID=7764 RepID=A0A8C4NJ17_EPTBU